MSTAFRYRIEFVFRDKQTRTKERVATSDQWHIAQQTRISSQCMC